MYFILILGEKQKLIFNQWIGEDFLSLKKRNKVTEDEVILNNLSLKFFILRNKFKWQSKIIRSGKIYIPYILKAHTNSFF